MLNVLKLGLPFKKQLRNTYYISFCFTSRYDIDMKYVFPIPHDNCKDKPARADYFPILVQVDSKVPQKPGVSYNIDSRK